MRMLYKHSYWFTQTSHRTVSFNVSCNHSIHYSRQFYIYVTLTVLTLIMYLLTILGLFYFSYFLLLIIRLHLTSIIKRIWWWWWWWWWLVLWFQHKINSVNKQRCVLYSRTKIHAFLSASLYFSKRGTYWDRLCRDVVVRWLSRACTVAKRCILGLFCQITLTSSSFFLTKQVPWRHSVKSRILSMLNKAWVNTQYSMHLKARSFTDQNLAFHAVMIFSARRFGVWIDAVNLPLFSLFLQMSAVIFAIFYCDFLVIGHCKRFRATESQGQAATWNWLLPQVVLVGVSWYFMIILQLWYTMSILECYWIVHQLRRRCVS